MQPAEQPKQQQDDQDEAQDAAQAAPAVITVSVVATTAAKDQNEHDDNKDEGQGDACEVRPGLEVAISTAKLWLRSAVLAYQPRTTHESAFT
jgi:hypothetical protein